MIPNILGWLVVLGLMGWAVIGVLRWEDELREREAEVERQLVRIEKMPNAVVLEGFEPDAHVLLRLDKDGKKWHVVPQEKEPTWKAERTDASGKKIV